MKLMDGAYAADAVMCDRQKQKDKHEELERSAAELAARLKRTLGELDALQNQKKVLEIALSRNNASSAAPTASILNVRFSA